ncbi:MAG: pyridoxal phosphate-dependent aminotransferase [Coleofasciculus sp. S288]|nr:pyridoxal phosphate-dependent aminotransferase [Coleofasciculus sp. S288]
MKFAKRLQSLQANVFADMDQAKAKAKASGKEIIDLSLGSSDLAASPHVIAAIEASMHDPSTHGYLLFHGTQAFRQAAASWYTKRYGIPVDPETEVLSLIGCQEGTAHLPLAVLNPGDFALLQDPGYPSHAGGVYLAGGQVYPMPLLAENEFLPVFEDIPSLVLSQARMMVLSYPHNPTTAIAPLSFFQKAVAFCRQHDLVLVHDLPYADLVFSEEEGEETPVLKIDAKTRGQGDTETERFSSFVVNANSWMPNLKIAEGAEGAEGAGEAGGEEFSSLLCARQRMASNPKSEVQNPKSLAPSILQADPDKTVSIEFFTFSKSYNMGGFRIGYAVGNAQLIRALRQVKAVIDFNQYRGILNGAIAALNSPQEGVKATVATFQKRRDAFVQALYRIGWQVPIPKATMYVWAKLPQPWESDSVQFCTQLVEETGVAASPGAGFGKAGEGYVRFALVHEPAILETAVERIAGFLR